MTASPGRRSSITGICTSLPGLSGVTRSTPRSLQFTETAPDARETLLWREQSLPESPAAHPAAVAVCAGRGSDVMAAAAAGAIDQTQSLGANTTITTGWD